MTEAGVRAVRVVVADDQRVVRDGIAAMIAAAPGLEVVGTAADGGEAVDVVAATSPDVVVMDVRMPRVDGIEATREVVAAHPAARVLVLTTFDLDEYVYDALRAGASGFLLKDAPAERLVEAVRLVAEGSMLLGPSVTRRLVQDVARRRRPARDPRLGARTDSRTDSRTDPRTAGLTPREREVMLALARGLSNAEIAAELVVAEETVKSHVSEVLRKTGCRDRVQVVVVAYESGLVGGDPAGPARA